jgi:tetratricopeptide (TPR) repeat protein
LLVLLLDTSRVANHCPSCLTDPLLEFANAVKFEDKAIVSATRLINDANLQNNARFVSVLGAAYYVRGLAYEKQGNTTQAILDFQSALQLVPEYELAKQALSLRGR